MAMVNQQYEDDNNHGSRGSTNSIDEIARVNASKEAELVRLIRLCFENMWPTIHVNQSHEDDNNNGAGGRTSSIDELAMDSTSTGMEKERAICLCKETLWPMICAENQINSKQQNIFSVIKEKYGLDLLKERTWNNSGASTSGSPVFQFQFLNGISTPVSTGKNIEGKYDESFVVALVDQRSGQVVTTGAEAETEIEIVVLQGDCKDVEAENWTSDEFNRSIISEWNGKKVLQGITYLKLKEGIASVNNISFTHNSTWKGKRRCRLGARSVDAVFATRVKEAKTESFPITDKRNLRYNKHAIPLLSDHVYRLYGINWRSACYKRLKEANIKTVMDFRTLNAINAEMLKDILKVRCHQWKIIMEHVQKCKDDKGIYLYHNPRDDQKRDGVVFNVSGHLVGLVADSQFLPWQKLSSHKKVDAQKVVVSASEHWNEVVPFNDEASLINHLQSGSGTTLNSFRNALNLVIPDTSLITPISPTSQNERKHDIVGVSPTGQSSQSPKRPASEHAISNSPKKPRDNHQQSSLFMPNVTTSRMLTNTDATLEVSNDNEYLQYLNLSHGQKWKRVWCVAGWISVFSKIRKRQMTSDNNTFIVIEASIEHMQI